MNDNVPEEIWEEAFICSMLRALRHQAREQ